VVGSGVRGRYLLAPSVRNYVRHLREIAAGRQGNSCRRDRLIWDRGAFKDRIFQIVNPALRYFQPRIFVDGVQLRRASSARSGP
jgi:hypothetical protein